MEHTIISHIQPSFFSPYHVHPEHLNLTDSPGNVKGRKEALQGKIRDQEIENL